MDSYVKRQLELNDEARTITKKNYSLVVEVDGYNNLTLGETDCRNCLDNARLLRLGTRDAKTIRKYFIKMKSKNSNFFYIMDLDDKNRLRNVFWIDA